MQKNLLIVFAKNKLYGKVKTRLAQTVGDQAAYEVYARLFGITERETSAVSGADIHVYYSHLVDPGSWIDSEKFVQQGETLGDRMKQAFEYGFEQGYQNIVGVGADLPEMTSDIIEDAFEKLDKNRFVIGPAEDGGYYLIGLSAKQGTYIFEDKPWSTSVLFDLTKKEILDHGDSICLLDELNDIDTIDDLERSIIAPEFAILFDRTSRRRAI